MTMAVTMTHPRRVALLALVAASHRPFGTAAAPLRQRRQQEQREEATPAAWDEPPAIPEPSASASGPGSGSLIAMQFTADPYAGRDGLELVLAGEFGLAALRYAPSSFRFDGTDAYDAVYGEFCAHDPALDGADPSALPTAAARAAAAEHCGEHRRALPLRDVVAAAAARAAAAGAPPVAMGGLLFHEGFAGAGLLASALAAAAGPTPTRVVAEHPALRDALAACDVIRNRYRSDDCDAAKQRRLVADVVALLGRAPGAAAGDAPPRLYLKIPSASAAYLPELRAMYPDAPWAFVYRTADEALAKATARPRRAACARARRNPSAALAAHAAARLEGAGHADLEGPSADEVCALHLAALLEIAAREHALTGTGLLVSYELDLRSNADAVVDRILPYLGLGEEIRADPQGARDRVSQILSTKSNTSGARRGQDTQWRGESVDVREEVAAASRAFMSGGMESIANLREGVKL